MLASKLVLINNFQTFHNQKLICDEKTLIINYIYRAKQYIKQNI